MNCDETRRHWHLYDDSEGDAELHWTISQHLDNCPACAEWFARQSRFETMLCEKLSTMPSDEQLWHGVLARAGLSRPVTSRRWFLFSSIAACAAALLVVGIVWLHRFADSSNTPSLSQLAAAWHEQWIAGQLHTPFESDSDLAVEDFLLRDVSFPVRCPCGRTRASRSRGPAPAVWRTSRRPTSWGMSMTNPYLCSYSPATAFPDFRCNRRN